MLKKRAGSYLREFMEVLTLSASAIALIPVASYLPYPSLSMPQSLLDDKSTDVMELLTLSISARIFAPSSPSRLPATLNTKIKCKSQSVVGCCQNRAGSYLREFIEVLTLSASAIALMPAVL